MGAILVQITLLLSAVVFVGRGATNFLAVGQVSENDVVTSLTAELEGGTAAGNRLQWIETALKPTFLSLPKNAAGNLGHEAVRYVLHRFFVQRGWFIRGLEANNDTSWRSPTKPLLVKEWVPDFLQVLLEKRLGPSHGTDLHHLMALAAALEDLVQKEAASRLLSAYKMHGLPLSGKTPEPEVEEALETYFIAYLKPGNLTVQNLEELHMKKWLFSRRYRGYSDAKAWFNSVLAHHLSPDRVGKLDFAGAVAVTTEIGETFHELNDKECRSLKKKLQGMEGKKPGRVRLSSFYNASLHSHWRFTEKVDYLKRLGALDDSDPQQLRLIMPNYIMSRPNCLEASHLYAVCCRNECEDLLGFLEKQIGAPTAELQTIAELVFQLPSNTVSAPRNLSTALMDRLYQVARENYGRIPLHGRLFAQWMHHAFPRECPYPHEAGTTSPQTPDEWMEETGQETTASQEEMLEHVAKDVCASGVAQLGSACSEETEELPWSNAEELLAVGPEPSARKEEDVPADAGERLLSQRVGLMTVVGIAFLVTGGKNILGAPAHWVQVQLTLAVLLLLYVSGLLDNIMLLLAFCGGLGMLAVRQLAARQVRKRICHGEGKLDV